LEQRSPCWEKAVTAKNMRIDSEMEHASGVGRLYRTFVVDQKSEGMRLNYNWTVVTLEMRVRGYKILQLAQPIFGAVAERMLQRLKDWAEAQPIPPPPEKPKREQTPDEKAAIEELLESDEAPKAHRIREVIEQKKRDRADQRKKEREVKQQAESLLKKTLETLPKKQPAETEKNEKPAAEKKEQPATEKKEQPGAQENTAQATVEKTVVDEKKAEEKNAAEEKPAPAAVGEQVLPASEGKKEPQELL
jgi:hypothetical protein